MAKVKQIINCETNKKFIKVYGNGFIDIPDVIYHVLTDDGMMHVWGDILHGDVPQIGKELPEDGGSLSYWIDGEKLDKLLAYFKKEYDSEIWAEEEVTRFYVRMKQQLPYINIDTKAENIRCRVKKIISCETNKKFIQFHDEGNFFIPDVIFYVQTENGNVVAYGEEFCSDFPKVGEKLYTYPYRLIGQISSYIIEEMYNEYKEAYGEKAAKKKYNNFISTVREQIPMLGIKEGVCLQPLIL